MNLSKARRVLQAVAVAVVIGAGASTARAAAYGGTDLLFVAYEPGGREFVASLGPASSYTRSASPVPVTQFTAADLRGVFGGPLPANLRVAIIGAGGVDSYLSSNGPAGTDAVGSAIGAANQIRSLGGSLASLSREVAGNEHAGYFEFGDPGSYQATLNARNAGSLGSNVPFNVESALGASTTDVPFYQGGFNPFVDRGASRSRLGIFRIRADGSVVYVPARKTASQRADAPASPEGPGGPVSGTPVSRGSKEVGS